MELINCGAHPTNLTLSASLDANVTHLHHGPPKLHVEVQRLQASDAQEPLHVAPGGGIFPQLLILLQYSTPILQVFGQSLLAIQRLVDLNEQEQFYMAKMPYVFARGSLMYVMVCTRLNIAHAVGVMSRYMSNMSKQH